jgi:hypothetical protein
MARWAVSASFQKFGSALSSSSSWISCALAGMSKTHPDLIEALEAAGDRLLDVLYHRSSLAAGGTGAQKVIGSADLQTESIA